MDTHIDKVKTNPQAMYMRVLVTDLCLGEGQPLSQPLIKC